MADLAENPDEKADLLGVEQRWLAIARIYDLKQRPEGQPKKKPGP